MKTTLANNLDIVTEKVVVLDHFEQAFVGYDAGTDEIVIVQNMFVGSADAAASAADVAEALQELLATYYPEIHAAGAYVELTYTMEASQPTYYAKLIR